jgi:hypothetical protein
MWLPLSWANPKHFHPPSNFLLGASPIVFLPGSGQVFRWTITGLFP